MAMVSTPLWGSIADKFHLHRVLMFCCVIGLCTSPLCLIFIPVANQDICSGKEFNGSKINVFEPSTNNPFMNSSVSSPSEDELDAFYPDNVQTEYVVVDNDVTHFTAPQESATSNHGDSLRTFLTAFCSMLFVYMFIINWHVLIDSTTIELCNKYTGSSYGQQRYLASLSVVVMSLIAGFLMEWSERRGAARGDVCYNSRYFMPLVLTCVSCAFIALFPLSKIEVISKAPTKSFYKSFFKLLKRLNVFRFLLVLIITGASKGVIVTYLFLFLEDLNASKIVIGLCPVFECLAEIPCMYISQRLISKLGSSAVMTIGVFGHFIRQLANSFPTNPVLILPIEALHGVTFGFLWPSLVIYANQIAPEGMSSTMQAMVTAFDEGLGKFKNCHVLWYSFAIVFSLIVRIQYFNKCNLHNIMYISIIYIVVTNCFLLINNPTLIRKPGMSL